MSNHVQTPMGCWFCGSQMKWDSDIPLDELASLHNIKEGFLAFLSCSECEAEAIFTSSKGALLSLLKGDAFL